MADLEPTYIKMLIILATICGLAVASYIRKKKTHHETLVCPLDTDCNAVVNSKYSKFLGMPVEVMGVIYYAVFLGVYIVILFLTPFNDLLEITLIVLSSIAALFSLYLVGLQAFVIKEFCLWCMISFAAALAIFGLFVWL